MNTKHPDPSDTAVIKKLRDAYAHETEQMLEHFSRMFEETPDPTEWHRRQRTAEESAK